MSRVAALWEEWADEDSLGSAYSVFGGGEPSGDPTFPFAPLPVVVEMWLGWWEGITNYVLVRDRITIRRGQADEASTPEPGSMTLTLNNRDGRFSPRNPTGPYYGLIGRNTLIRVRVELSDIVTEDQTRFVSEVSEWPSRWDVSGQDVWVPVTAQGILRRLGQGSSPVRSPLRASILAAATPNEDGEVLLAYWPMEDGDASTTAFASGLPAGAPATYTGTAIAFAADDLLPGSAALAVFNDDTAITAPVTASFTAGRWGVTWVCSFVSAPASTTTLMEVQVSGGSAARWVLTATATTLTLTGYSSAGAALYTTSNSDTVHDALFSGVPVAVEIYTTEDGDDFGVTVYDLDGTGVGFSNTSAPLTAGSVTQWSVPASTELGDNLVMGHVAVANYIAPSYVSPGSGPTALQAYAGETAADRAARLCTETGVSSTLVGAAADTMAMGPQPVPATFTDAYDETWAADLALASETRGELGLTFRTRQSLYNQTAALTLDYDGAGEIAPDLAPTEDDQHVRNDVTVKRTAGGAARYVKESGALSVLDPPDGVGRYDTEVELNLYDANGLLDHAGWRVHVGTWDEARYPKVPVNMAALAANGKTSLMAVVAGLAVGDRVTLTNLPDWLPPDDVDLLVLGFEETIGVFDWMITLV